MSLITNRYYYIYKKIEDLEEKRKFECNITMIILNILMMEECKNKILENENNNLTTVFIPEEYTGQGSVLLKFMHVECMGKEYNCHIFCIYYQKYIIPIKVKNDFFDVDFKKLTKRNPSLLKTLSDHHQYIPDFDVYKTKNSYKFRFPCSNLCCKKREGLKLRFKVCNKCLKTQYCSRECQIEDWKEHKLKHVFYQK